MTDRTDGPASESEEPGQRDDPAQLKQSGPRDRDAKDAETKPEIAEDQGGGIDGAIGGGQSGQGGG